MFTKLDPPEDGRNWALECPYNERHVDDLRKLPVRRWDGELKRNLFGVWNVDQAVRAIKHLVRAEAVPVPDEIVGMVRQGIGELDEAMERIAGLEEEFAERGLALMPFQVEGVAWLCSRRFGLLADEMGLGKTIQTLAAIPVGAPVVVVCPAIVIDNWIQEVDRWRPDLGDDVIRTGRVRGKKVDFQAPIPGQLVITNYEALPDLDQIPSFHAGTVLVLDEAHLLKGRNSKRSQLAGAIAEAVADCPSGRVYGLTGTPVVNKPQELWTVLSVLRIATTAFPGGFWEFAEMAGASRGEYGLSWGDVGEDVFDALDLVMLRRERKDVLPQLPEKVRRFVSVHLSESDKRLVDACGMDPSDVEKALKAGVEFESLSHTRLVLAKAKISAMLSIVETYEQERIPLIVFSSHREPVSVLGSRPGWGAISGDISLAKREDAVSAFQRGDLMGLGVVIRAGAIGINLTRAAHGLFVDLDWTTAANQQAEDRICRIGADRQRGCTFTILMADHPVDERVVEVLAEKSGMIERLVEVHEASTSGVVQDVVTRRQTFEMALSVGRSSFETARKRANKRISEDGAVYCPRCFGSTRLTELKRRTSHSTRNPDREFLTCPRCDFFSWADREESIRKQFRNTVPKRVLKEVPENFDTIVSLLAGVAKGPQGRTAQALIRRLEWNSLDVDTVEAAKAFLRGIGHEVD